MFSSVLPIAMSIAANGSAAPCILSKLSNVGFWEPLYYNYIAIVRNRQNSIGSY